VLPRNIRDNRIGSQNLDVVPPVTAERMARYRLIAGEIVTARAGTLGRYGGYSKSRKDGCLAPAACGFGPMTGWIRIF